jgi:hypothetical protein
MSSGGGHEGLSTCSGGALCEPDASTFESGAAAERLRNADSMLSTDDKAVNLEIILKLVIVLLLLDSKAGRP